MLFIAMNYVDDLLIQDEYLKSGATFILDDLVFKSNDNSVACVYIRVSQWVKQILALPLLWQGSTPTDENPAGHEEDLAPAVHEHLFVGVGSSAVLHRVVTRAHNLCHDNRQLIVIAINRNHSASKINCN